MQVKQKPQNEKLLKNKIAVITGGSSGIGLGIARYFAAAGATVVIVGRRQDALDAAIMEIGASASGFRADVSNIAELDALYNTIQTQHGRIDILVANAGGGEFATLGSITEEHFDRTFSINVKGVLFTVQQALPLLSDGSSVILIGSSTSIKGTPSFSVYSATKAAVRNFARTWILDLKDRHIRVNVLSPGPTRTPGLLGIVPEDQQDAMLNHMADNIPLGRVGEPDDVSNAAIFLASDHSSFVNGIELFVDGGMVQI